MPEFQKKVQLRVINEFAPKSDVAEVLAFVREQKVPGELIISLPGNGGVSSITFREKGKTHRGETSINDESN